MCYKMTGVCLFQQLHTTIISLSLTVTFSMVTLVNRAPFYLLTPAMNICASLPAERNDNRSVKCLMSLDLVPFMHSLYHLVGRWWLDYGRYARSIIRWTMLHTFSMNNACLFCHSSRHGMKTASQCQSSDSEHLVLPLSKKLDNKSLFESIKWIYRMNHCGVALVAKLGIRLEKINCGQSLKTFDYLCCRVSTGSSSVLFTCLMVYRLSSQAVTNEFFNELSSLLRI